MAKSDKKWEDFEKEDSSTKKSESAMDLLNQINDNVTELILNQKNGQTNTPAAEPIAEPPADESMPTDIPGGSEDMAGMGVPEQDMSLGNPVGEPSIDNATPTPTDAPPANMSDTPSDIGGAPTEEGIPADMPPAEQPPMEAPPQSMIDAFTPPMPTDTASPEDDDINKILDSAKEMKDPELKMQMLAIAYQKLDSVNAQRMAPPMQGGGVPPEIVQAAVEAGAPEEAFAYSENAHTEKSDKTPDQGIASSIDAADKVGDKGAGQVVKLSDDEDKESEPGVTDAPAADTTEKEEKAPEIAEVVVETSEPIDEATDGMDKEKMKNIKHIFFETLSKIFDRIFSGPMGEDSFQNCAKSIADMVDERNGIKKDAPQMPAKPEFTEDTDPKELVALIAQKWDQLTPDEQDQLVNILDHMFGQEQTNAMLKEAGLDLSEIYESGEAVSEDAPKDGPKEDKSDDEKKDKSEEKKDDKDDEKKDGEKKDDEKKEAPFQKSIQSGPIGKHINSIDDDTAVAKSKQGSYTPILSDATSGQQVSVNDLPKDSIEDLVEKYAAKR